MKPEIGDLSSGGVGGESEGVAINHSSSPAPSTYPSEDDDDDDKSDFAHIEAGINNKLLKSSSVLFLFCAKSLMIGECVCVCVWWSPQEKKDGIKRLLVVVWFLISLLQLYLGLTL